MVSPVGIALVRRVMKMKRILALILFNVPFLYTYFSFCDIFFLPFFFHSTSNGNSFLEQACEVLYLEFLARVPWTWVILKRGTLHSFEIARPQVYYLQLRLDQTAKIAPFYFPSEDMRNFS